MGNDHFCDAPKRAAQRRTPHIKGESLVLQMWLDKPLIPQPCSEATPKKWRHSIELPPPRRTDLGHPTAPTPLLLHSRRRRRRRLANILCCSGLFVFLFRAVSFWAVFFWGVFFSAAGGAKTGRSHLERLSWKKCRLGFRRGTQMQLAEWRVFLPSCAGTTLLLRACRLDREGKVNMAAEAKSRVNGCSKGQHEHAFLFEDTLSGSRQKEERVHSIKKQPQRGYPPKETHPETHPSASLI